MEPELDLKLIKEHLMGVHASLGDLSLGVALGTMDGEVIVGTGTAGEEFDATIAVRDFSKVIKNGAETFNELKAGELMYVMLASHEKIGLVMPVGDKYFIGLAALQGLSIKRAMFQMKIAQNRLAQPLYGEVVG
ncbi:MAG: roadblock/LC7 domain-containing protein [Candidatus Syntropharchaeales archaeon]